MSDVDGDYKVAVMDDGKDVGTARETRSPLAKTRSLSDGGGTPKLSPSPHIFEMNRQQSKDDIGIRDKERERQRERETNVVPPSTPIRAGFPIRGLSLQLPPRESTSPIQQSSYIQPAPLSPKLDHSHIYASPTNILPRRSRGLDFSRAATSLHHSTLAEQASPGSSPTIGSRAMNIPSRRNGEFGTAEQSSNSLWTIMGNHEKMHVSSSLGSNTHMCSDSSSSSGEDDLMDEDMDDTYVTTPQVSKPVMPSHMHSISGAPWMPGGSPAMNSLLSFQQRQRQRKQHKKKVRGPLGFGFHSPAASSANRSRSPPSGMSGQKELSSPHARRESISWAANQLHISGNESDDNMNRQLDEMNSPSRPGVIRRPVTRRGNLLGFARIRAALAEESAPVDAEVRREAEVVRQVRESDMDLEIRHPPTHSAATTALSSPNLATQEANLDEITDDVMMVDPNGGTTPGLGLAGSFKKQALKNSKGNIFWDTFSDSSMSAPRITPPPPCFGLARGSSSGLSLDGMSMDSPSAGSTSASQNPFVLPGAMTATSSSSGGTPQPLPGQASGTVSANGIGNGSGNGGVGSGVNMPPTAAEITRRINSKRRRDDDFDPVSFKRRAVSPGMSVHNSPIMQSPLQRDMAPWGTATGSRPGSVGGDTTGKGPGGNGGGSDGGGNNNRMGVGVGGKGLGRIGFQGMVDTNDGITRLSIE
ncbi:hypothetical protein B0H67DRAFT_556662 [Lasiosphaeris hirsuta]|uniref:Uncharacterized protein n=1 Tax=Lasiosphaeris hirsuta TaxID=260670 RepID=A0AA40A2J5_9PEZI|nr:hypothetical protein B0H67DRAFT_556662 [Lasiosphaeris hirsuta]